MPKLFLDFGNADIKWYDGNGNYGYFRHALAELNEKKMDRLMGRSTLPPEGLLIVNGKGAAIGDAARRHTIKERPMGAARYTKEYFGFFLAHALTQCFKKGSNNIALYASYAPQDVDYATDIVEACLGEWNIISAQGKVKHKIKRVETFDEPFGGFNHFILTQSGRERKDNPVAELTCLIVDVGGHTVDVMAVDAGGDIDLSTLDSTRTGVIQLKKQFESDIRMKHKAKFRKAGNLDDKRVESALLNGQYPYGKTKLDVSSEAIENVAALANDVLEIIDFNGGAANYDIVLLTGGGAALIFEPLKNSLPEMEFQLVEDNRDNMRYANVFGASKLFKLLDRVGAL